jgi:MOSC domain-containing protein YiiM
LIVIPKPVQNQSYLLGSNAIQNFGAKDIKIISINVELPREVTWKGKTVATGIFKEPVSERVIVRSLNLDTDRQADLTVHKGLDKAVYVYPFEHYDY